MEHSGYPRSRFATLLDMSAQELQAADRLMREAEGFEASDLYQARDLSAYRARLNRFPTQGPCRRQLFLNFKGGTGKTSLSSSYSFRLAEMGYRVMLLDLDAQGHAAKCLGYDSENCEKTLFDVLVKRVPLREVIIHTPIDELHIVPSNLTMSRVDLSLMPMHAREFKLQQALGGLATSYDFIIMDAPPSFGLLNLNALLATHDLFIPVLADFLSFHGLKLLFETISELEQDLQLGLEHIFVVINHFNPTTRIARQARQALEEHYSDSLLKTVIRQCTKFAQASGQGIPISVFDPGSKAARDIESLIAEVLPLSTGTQPKEPQA